MRLLFSRSFSRVSSQVILRRHTMRDRRSSRVDIVELLDSTNARDRVSGLIALSEYQEPSSRERMLRAAIADPSDYVACTSIVLLKTMGNSGASILRSLVSAELNVARLHTVISVLTAIRDCGAVSQVRCHLNSQHWQIKLIAIKYLLHCRRDAAEFASMLKSLEHEVCEMLPLSSNGFVPDPIFSSRVSALRELKTLRRWSRRWRRRRWVK